MGQEWSTAYLVDRYGGTTPRSRRILPWREVQTAWGIDTRSILGNLQPHI